MAEVGDHAVRILDLEVRGIDGCLLEILGITVSSHRHTEVEAEEESVIEIQAGIHDKVVLGAVNLYPGILVQCAQGADVI